MLESTDEQVSTYLLPTYSLKYCIAENSYQLTSYHVFQILIQRRILLDTLDGAYICSNHHNILGFDYGNKYKNLCMHPKHVGSRRVQKVDKTNLRLMMNEEIRYMLKFEDSFLPLGSKVSLKSARVFSLSACQSVRLYLASWPLVLFILEPIHPWPCLSVCQSVSLSACQSVSLSVCQSVCKANQKSSVKA